MTPQEFDTSLTDLETRVDRLRALYENWFRGYEKSEPMVARKEVERRVYAMRKELPRNTALRFRYHQLYQRFTTLANYWQRTARQIEEGTYRLQLQRMRRRRPGDDVAATLPPRTALADDDTPPPANSYELNLDETLDVQKLLDESDFDEVASALERRAPVRDSALSPSAPSSPSAPPSGGGRRFSRPPALSDAPKRPSLTLELGGEDVDGQSPILAPSSSIPAGGPRPGRPSMIVDAQRSASSAPSGSAPSDPGQLPELPKPPRLPVAPLAGPPMASLAPPASLGRSPPAAGRDGPTTVPRPPVPPPPPPGALSRAPGAMPVSPGARPPVPSLPASRAPQPGTMPSSSAGRAPLAPPRPPAVAPSASLSEPAAARKPAAPTGEAPTPLSDQRMRRIYDEYAAARRKNNEGEVRFETLAGSIQKMLPELTKKHQGKQIDFEVVVKDGRVGLKPRAT